MRSNPPLRPVSGYFRYSSPPIERRKSILLWQDRVQTQQMSLLDLNSNPQETAPQGPEDPEPGLNAALAVVNKNSESTVVPVLSADLEGKITGCSASSLEIFGLNAQSTLGQKLAAFATSEDDTAVGQLQ